MSFKEKEDSEKKYFGKIIRVKDKKEKIRTDRPERDYYDEPEDQPEAFDSSVDYSRAVVFVITRIILAVVVIILVWMGFNIGLNSMNVYTLAKDAMTLRTDVALQPDKVEEGKVEKYFTLNCIARDEVLSGDPYGDYEITNYYDRVIVDTPVIWPWQSEYDVTLVQQVMDITGTYSAEHLADLGKTEEDVADEEIQIPEWKNGEYSLKYIKQDDGWIIDEIKFVSEAPERMMKEYNTDEEEVTDTDTKASASASTAITTVS